MTRRLGKEYIAQDAYYDEYDIFIGVLEHEEVIRCKDCKHWWEEDHICGLRDCYGWDYKPDSFCSWAERKEE